MGKLAFVFPGQGSAAVGMGEEIAATSPAARSTLKTLRNLLPDVDRRRSDGPKEELIRTDIAQPAIFAVDCACLEALRERGVRPDLVAGHSLGEFAGLVAAEVLTFEVGLRLVTVRGSLMEQAAAAHRGSMLAVLGLDGDVVARLVSRWADSGPVACANDNAPGQIVISGDSSALREAAEELKASGARVMPLAVGGAFHSPLMRAAEDAFSLNLCEASFADPSVPLVSNRTASIGTDAAALKAALLPQITSSVRWRESVNTMLAAGVDRFVEVGPGKVLSGLVQRCARGSEITILNVEDSASLERTLSALDS